MNAMVLNGRNGLVALAVALGLAVGLQANWTSGLAASGFTLRGVAGTRDVASVLPDFRLGSDAVTYSQIVDKPLLNPTRRAAPTQAVVAPVEPPKPQIRRGLYQLVGVTDFGSAKIAQIRELSNSRITSVREGDTLQEFTVKLVSADQVVLAFDSETDTIALPSYTASSRVPPPSRQPVSTQPVARNDAASPPQAPAQTNAQVRPATVAAQPTDAVDRNAMLSPTPLPNGQPYTTANAEAFIEARRRARFGQ